jgi:hypothetical protein
MRGEKGGSEKSSCSLLALRLAPRSERLDPRRDSSDCSLMFSRMFSGVLDVVLGSNLMLYRCFIEYIVVFGR